MEAYHLRRSEKEIADKAVLFDIVKAHRYVTLALCKGDEPYLVTLNYGFDAEAETF